MMRKIAILLLFSGPLAFSQQPMQLPGHTPRQNPMGDDPNAPSKNSKKHESSTKDLQQKLQKALDNKNAAYKGSNIKPVVDDQNVTLTGSVTSSMQREMALQVVRAYTEDRKIVDKLVVQ